MRTPLREWLAEGTPQRWLAAAAVLIALAMIAGLVVVVVEVAGTYFWPTRLTVVELVDGSRFLGEEWDREADPSVPGQERFRFKVGNRDLQAQDFRWIRETDVVRHSEPADAWVLERREYGNFYGFPVRLDLPQGTAAAAGPQFAGELQRHLASFRRLHREQQRLLARSDRLHQPVARLLVQISGARFRGEDVAELQVLLSAAQAREQEEVAPILGRLEEVREELRGVHLVMVTAGGVERSLPLASVVRAVPVNVLTAHQKFSVYFSRWWEFLFDAPRESNTEGGIFPALFGTALMVLIMTVVVVPFGVITAVYLNEYARDTFFTHAVRLALSNLAGVPSIVFGAFGLAFFVYTVGGGIDRLFFSSTLPTPTFGTGGILWAALTLALLTVPVVVVATEEGLQAVPQTVRDGARALGATRWQTLRRVVLPYAAPGILTGTILAVARAAGEVAPLMLTGVVKLAPHLPLDGVPPFLHLERKFMHLGFHIYDVGFQSPNVEAAKPMVYATVLVLLVLVVVLNLAAIMLRNRLRRRLRSAVV